MKSPEMKTGTLGTGPGVNGGGDGAGPGWQPWHADTPASGDGERPSAERVACPSGWARPLRRLGPSARPWPRPPQLQWGRCPTCHYSSGPRLSPGNGQLFLGPWQTRDKRHRSRPRSRSTRAGGRGGSEGPAPHRENVCKSLKKHGCLAFFLKAAPRRRRVETADGGCSYGALGRGSQKPRGVGIKGTQWFMQTLTEQATESRPWQRSIPQSLQSREGRTDGHQPTRCSR